MAEERVQRKLAAILAADVVGYSRLMSGDDTGTLSRLKALRAEMFDPKTGHYGGRIFKTTGDGAFAEFGSAVDAVQCSVEIQRELAERNANVPKNERMALRIGISLGDVIVDGDDLYGNGVNVAARMEGLAEPGGICISGNVHEQIASSLRLSVDDLGEQTVKNIDWPIRCYRVQLTPSDRVETSTPLPLPDKPSIAVLPFANISGDPEQEYFSDGITEDLITDLSKLAGLFVISRNSAFAYKGQNIDSRAVGQELGVRHILEGSVRKAGRRVRVNAQLIETESGGHLWAERYDGDLAEIFELQDVITEKIVSALEVQLSEQETQNRMSKYVPNWDAYDQFLRGRRMAHETYFRRTSEVDDRPDQSWLGPARDLFERTIELDPDFAGGYAGLSWTYSVGVRQGLSTSPDEDKQEAFRLGQKAVDMDPTFGWSHTALASAQLIREQFEDAVATARHGIEAQPNDADAHAYLGLCLILSGVPEEALAHLHDAMRLDPRYHMRTIAWRGFALFNLRQYADAVENLEKVVVPGGIVIHHTLAYLAAAYVRLGRIEEADKTIAQLLDRYPDFTVGKMINLMKLKRAADSDHLANALIEAGLPDGSAVSDAALPLPDKPSIAVLPFENMSGDPEQEYFADGITEDIITELSRFRTIFVIARNSSFAFKGKSVDIPEVAEQLGVQYVLEGSVRKAGMRVRINAQLIDASTGAHVWADRYDREFTDIFDLQDELTRAIVAILPGRLEDAGRAHSERKRTTNMSAYELVLLGNEHLRRHSREEIVEAIRFYQNAIDLDPGYARAHASLAWANACFAFRGSWTDPCVDEALKSIEKSISLDGNDSWSHGIYSQILIMRHRYDEAEIQFERALALNPNDADVAALWSPTLVYLGRWEEGLEWIDTAKRLNPYPGQWYYWYRGFALFSAKEYEQAAKAIKELTPVHLRGHAYIAACYGYLDKLEDARKELTLFEEAWDREKAAIGEDALHTIQEVALDWAARYRDPSDGEHFLNGLRKAGLAEN